MRETWRFLFVLFLSVAATKASRKCDREEDCLSSGESRPHQLRSNFTYPCSGVVSDRVRKFETVVWVVSNNYSNCFDNSNRNAVLRVWTHSNSSSDRQPIVFVTRSDENVQTWKLPTYRTTFKETFNSFSRTICSTAFRDNDTVEEDVAMYIDMFTSDTEEIEFELSVEPVDDFELELDVPIMFEVAADSPQMYYFKFPEGHSRVVVTASSNDSGCAIVSVQNATCPVNEVLENARSKGVYQTMTKAASLTITAGETIEGDDFFVVIVADVCSDLSPHVPLQQTQETQHIVLTITPSKFAEDYIGALLFPLVFCGIGVVVMIIFILLDCWFITCRPVCSKECCQFDRPDCTCCCKYFQSTREGNELLLLLSDSSSGNGIIGTSDSKTEEIDKNTNNSGEENASASSKSLLDKSDKSITVVDLLKEPILSLEKQYSVYGWNTVTVGIFYALPAFQLILAEQLILNDSGNQDKCYYNFKCSRPLGVLSSFNNVWSCISYVILGVFFICIVGYRHCKEKWKHCKEKWKHCKEKWKHCKEKRKHPEENGEDSEKKVKHPEEKGKHPNHEEFGVPHFFGVYYAMGFALIMEGVMGSFYHICPNNSNFQFDTAFMYIIGGLMILKIFQTRHPDIHANAYVAFLSFAVVIFLTLIGVVVDVHHYLETRITLFILVIVFICIFSISFYFYHNWSLDNCRCGNGAEKKGDGAEKIGDGAEKTRDGAEKTRDGAEKTGDGAEETRDTDNKCQRVALCPRHGIRFFKMAFVVTINIIAVPVILFWCKRDVATFVLFLFIENFLLFTLMYVLSKLCYKEPWTVTPIICFFLLVVAWVAALYFFSKNVTKWEESPAVSREHNQDCFLLDFYDYHDIWHFLAAIALFFSFLFLLTLDDGLIRMKRNKIHSF